MQVAPLRLGRGPLVAVLMWIATTHLGAQSVQLRGPGGYLEAVGGIAATFQLTLSMLDGCSQHEKHRAKATAIGEAYVARNKPDFMSVMRKLPALAQREGGDGEVKRVGKELEVGLTQIETAGRGARDSMKDNPQSCVAFMSGVERGNLDLRKSSPQFFARLGV